MASQRNRVYPLNEYNTISCTTLNATNVNSTTGLYAPSLTGSDVTTKRITAALNVTGTSGSTIISGFTATGAAIAAYQPVVFVTSGKILGAYVSGAAMRYQPGVFGVAAAAAADGASVSAITSGLVPMYTSGATALIAGQYVLTDISGSKVCCISASGAEITTGAASTIGIAVITGAAGIANVNHIWVCPGVI
jgi:hypothetical protein